MSLVHAPAALALKYSQPLLLHARVADAMRAGVISCTPDSSIDTVARSMAANQIHAVVVVRADGPSAEERTWGEVSDIDIVRAGLTEARERGAGVVTAGEIASTEVVTVSEDEPLERAAQLMVEHEVTHLVVTSPGSGHPASVISTLDIAGVLAIDDRAVRGLETGAPRGLSGSDPPDAGRA